MKIYYINLDFEKNRFNYINEQLNLLNNKEKFSIERFAGIYGKTLTIDIINQYIVNNTLVKNIEWNNFKFDKAVLAIYLTHIDLWKNILLTNKEEYSLIIEDDVIIPSNLYNQIEKNMKNIPKNWDIVFIGRSFLLKGDIINDNILRPHVVHERQTNHGMFSYLIKTSSIIKLINLITPLEHSKLTHIDWTIRNLYSQNDSINENKINAYYLIESIIKHDYHIESIKDKK